MIKIGLKMVYDCFLIISDQTLIKKWMNKMNRWMEVFMGYYNEFVRWFSNLELYLGRTIC